MEREAVIRQSFDQERVCSEAVPRAVAFVPVPSHTRAGTWACCTSPVTGRDTGAGGAEVPVLSAAGGR